MSDAAAIPVDASRYGSWALIAGGSEGIGASIARDLAQAGFNLILVARKSAPLEALADELRGAVDVRTLALDLTDETMLDRIRAISDDVDVGLLIYNAGASHRTGPFIDWALDDALKVVRLNTTSPMTLAWHFGKQMAARGKGGIVIMGSLAGNAGSPSVIPYSGAKAFSQIFSEGLWWEMKQSGVDVLHVVVGSTETPAMERLGIVFRQNVADQPEDVARYALANLGAGPVVAVPSMQARFRDLATVDRGAATESNGALVMGNTKGTWGKKD